MVKEIEDDRKKKRSRWTDKHVEWACFERKMKKEKWKSLKEYRERQNDGEKEGNEKEEKERN